MSSSTEISPSTQLLLVEIRKLFDEQNTKLDRRFAKFAAAREPRHASDEPVSTLTQFGVTQHVVADNWGGLFEQSAGVATSPSEAASAAPATSPSATASATTAPTTIAPAASTATASVVASPTSALSAPPASPMTATRTPRAISLELAAPPRLTNSDPREWIHYPTLLSARAPTTECIHPYLDGYCTDKESYWCYADLRRSVPLLGHRPSCGRPPPHFEQYRANAADSTRLEPPKPPDPTPPSLTPQLPHTSTAAPAITSLQASPAAATASTQFPPGSRAGGPSSIVLCNLHDISFDALKVFDKMCSQWWHTTNAILEPTLYLHDTSKFTMKLRVFTANHDASPSTLLCLHSRAHVPTSVCTAGHGAEEQSILLPSFSIDVGSSAAGCGWFERPPWPLPDLLAILLFCTRLTWLGNWTSRVSKFSGGSGKPNALVVHRHQLLVFLQQTYGHWLSACRVFQLTSLLVDAYMRWLLYRTVGQNVLGRTLASQNLVQSWVHIITFAEHMMAEFLYDGRQVGSLVKCTVLQPDSTDGLVSQCALEFLNCGISCLLLVSCSVGVLPAYFPIQTATRISSTGQLSEFQISLKWCLNCCLETTVVIAAHFYHSVPHYAEPMIIICSELDSHIVLDLWSFHTHGDLAHKMPVQHGHQDGLKVALICSACIQFVQELPIKSAYSLSKALEKGTQQYGVADFEQWKGLILQKKLFSMADAAYCPRCETIFFEDEENTTQCSKCFPSFCTPCRLCCHVGERCVSITPEQKLGSLQEHEKVRQFSKGDIKKTISLAKEICSIKEVLCLCTHYPCYIAGISRVSGCNSMVCENCWELYCFGCGVAACLGCSKEISGEMNSCLCGPWKPSWTWKPQCLPSVLWIISVGVDLGASTWDFFYSYQTTLVTKEGLTMICTSSRKIQAHHPFLLAERQEMCGFVHWKMQSLWSCYELILEHPKLRNANHVEVPCPSATKNELLLKLKASSINPVDWKIQEGMSDTQIWCDSGLLSRDKDLQVPWDPGGTKILHRLGGKPKLKKGGMSGITQDWAIIWALGLGMSHRVAGRLFSNYKSATTATMEGIEYSEYTSGAVLYIKKEFNLQSEPTVEGLIVAMSLIGATIITTFSGPVSDWIGRRPMLILSSILYFCSSLIMLWSPNVYVLLLARLIDGFSIGLAVTLVPLYISETAPPEIRGLLNTLPQFSGSVGMFLSYCMVFGMSLLPSPDWRIMLGVLAIPSLFFFGLTIFYLPESPRWLVSKGRMAEAKVVLQKLRGKEDVSGELSLLVEGLEVGGDTAIEEYIIGPATEPGNDHVSDGDKEQIILYGPEEGQSWIARPSKGPSMLGSVLSLASRHGSMVNQSVPLMDPIVTLFGSVHENMPQAGGSIRGTLFPNLGSMFSVTDQHTKHEQWDEENIHRDDDEYASDGARGDYEDNLHSPLLSRQTTSTEGKDIAHHGHRGSALSMRRPSLLGEGAEGVTSTDIGGGWQLAWKWSEKEGEDGKKEGGFKRVYLHQEGVPGSRRGSIVSLPGGGDVPEGGEFVHAAALVSHSALFPKDLTEPHMSGAAMVHPSEVAAKGSTWKDLFEPGVRRALLVGVGIQILQQFAGINGVLYYTPQILEQAGVAVLLSNLGLSSASASILISSLTTLLMLPSIGLAMRLMDLSGRRFLLLGTIPILIASLVILVVSNVIDLGTVAHAALSTVSVIIYFCCFVMGFGPIPNILCAEIFPTRVRGLCIAICALTFWIGDIIVTYSLPVMLNAIGLAGVFGIYAVVCLIAFVFVYLKVPETKGMPLEVITEFFAVGAKQAAAKA